MAVIVSAILLFLLSIGSGVAQRTVTPLEYGQYYGYPPDYSQTGAMVMNPHSYWFTQLPANSIKAVHGHFQHVAPARPDDDFPYNDLKQLEAQQIAAGGPPIFVTATYAGKSRPVYFSWHLGLDANNQPTTDPSTWSQAVNLRSDAYIQFFANNYVRQRLFQRPAVQNYWFAADNSAFWINLYGVLDDNNVFQPVEQFDPPFAQSPEDFLDSVVYFLSQVKQIAPDIHIMANEGTISDESRFVDIWTNFDGASRENITHGFDPNPWYRNDVYLAYTRCQWEGPAGKAVLLAADIPNDSTFPDKLRTAYVAYLIYRGPNFFFGPYYDNGQGVAISAYSQMQAALGTPVAAATNQDYNFDGWEGYRLYSRQTQKGMVYLNWSGQTQTVTLPTDQVCIDRSGNVVTTLTIPDLSGDYVLFQ